MKHFRCASVVFGAVAALATATAAHGDVLLANGGFETLTGTTGPLPDGYGYWRGDMSTIVLADNGIRPYEGTQMLRFDHSTPHGSSAAVGAELWQLIDVSEYRSTIRAGNGHAEAGAFFNRVAETIGTEIDTMFSLGLYSYAGSVDSFPSQWGHGELGTATTTLYSDSELQSWQNLHVTFDLPEETDFIAIRIGVTENMFNDVSGMEFAGHYADGVDFTLIPAPASLLCLLPAGLMGARRRRRTA